VRKNGFTIIEVLAVVAIIAVLASIIIVRTGTARRKSYDAAIQSGLGEVRNAAELYYNSNVTYQGVCDETNTTLSDEDDFGRIKNFVSEYNGPEGVIGCKNDSTSYAVISSLNTEDCWCVDSEGNAKEITLGGAANCREKLTTTVCP